MGLLVFIEAIIINDIASTRIQKKNMISTIIKLVNLLPKPISLIKQNIIIATPLSVNACFFIYLVKGLSNIE